MCQSPADPHWETDALSDDQQLAMRGGLRGRLAECKYSNMDAIAARARALCDDLLK